jgi:predicted AlkP superfamily pyrophosphatase or phosphodiesterase
MRKFVIATLFLLVVGGQLAAAQEERGSASNPIKHVLLISIDGMHALDLYNCVNGIAGTAPYCPTLAKLVQQGVNYITAFTPRPSDSFPGLTALVTGATPRSTGAFYDVSYDHSLSPPAKTTPYGIPGGANLCPGTVGTQVGYDEEADVDLTRVDAGGAINPDYLPRDPKNNCAPVYPHQFIRVNTIFNVAKAAGMTTAWSDKHQTYELTKGPKGDGLDDFFAPEINSPVVGLNGAAPFHVSGCETPPDTTSLADWTVSFQNIQCYDRIKVQAVLNWIDGKTHDGSASLKAVPAIFGMNFQAVSVGQKLHEASLGKTGGYLNARGTPSASLLSEIKFVDSSIGQFVAEIAKQGLASSTVIIVTAKHGQSPIDPHRILRIPADNPSLKAPSDVLNAAGISIGQALEDDVSVIWLTHHTDTVPAVNALTANEEIYGGGEIFYAGSDIIVAPDVGVTYTGGTKKIAEHGGSAWQDRNVMLVVSGPNITPKTVDLMVETRQVAPTILKALGLNPSSLEGVALEGTQVLPFSF